MSAASISARFFVKVATHLFAVIYYRSVNVNTGNANCGSELNVLKYK
jgi:hypothetical protein